MFSIKKRKKPQKVLYTRRSHGKVPMWILKQYFLSSKVHQNKEKTISYYWKVAGLNFWFMWLSSVEYYESRGNLQNTE